MNCSNHFTRFKHLRVISVSFQNCLSEKDVADSQSVHDLSSLHMGGDALHTHCMLTHITPWQPNVCDLGKTSDH